jgi:hypothetical protein
MVRQEFLQSSPEARQKFRLFAGHWGTDIHELLPPDTLWLTMLRDPVEQTMSWFYHMQHVIPPHPQVYEPLARWQPLLENDLLASLNSSFLTKQLANQQTRFLATAVHYAPFASPGEWETYDAFSVTETSMEDVYQKALASLNQMTAVGLAERFGDTVKLLCHLLGLVPPWLQPNYNLNKQRRQTAPNYYRRQLTPDLLQQLEVLLTYDRRLYEVAQQRFEQQMVELAHASQRLLAIRPIVRQIFYSVARFAWQPFLK